MVYDCGNHSVSWYCKYNGNTLIFGHIPCNTKVIFQTSDCLLFIHSFEWLLFCNSPIIFSLNSWDDYVKHGITIFQLYTMQFPESEVFFVGLVMAFTLTIGSTHLASGPL